MKLLRLAFLSTLLFVLAACAPGLSNQSAAFTATVKGKQYKAVNDVITYSTPQYVVDLQVAQKFVTVTLKNKTANSVKLNYDGSVFVMPDGTTSRAAPGTVSWLTRNDPQPSAVVPNGASVSAQLFPVDRAEFFSGSGIRLADIFGAPVPFRLSLALDVDGKQVNDDIAFKPLGGQ